MRGADIRDILTAWGLSKPINSAPNGYPHQANFAQSMVNPGDAAERARTIYLPPEECQRVDEVVSSMKERKPAHHWVIVNAYSKRMSDHEIAERERYQLRRVSRSWVRGIRGNAEHWLEAKLDV